MWLIRFLFLICSIAFTLSAGSELCSICGTISIQPRIFNGKETNFGPWSIYLEYSDDYNTNICSGTIIDYQHILTASHCFLNIQHLSSKEKSETISIYAGDVNKKGKESKVLEAESVTLHPNFFYPGGVNSFDDLAVIKLKKPIQISPKIRPICLGKVDFKPQDDGLIQGYGFINKGLKNKTDLGVSNKLMEATLRVQSDEQCRKVYGDMYTPNHLCAYRGTNGGCPGDSGGGFFYLNRGRQFQIGLTSFGGHCDGFENKPMVFTRVSSYLPWIMNVTKSNLDCSPNKVSLIRKTIS